MDASIAENNIIFNDRCGYPSSKNYFWIDAFLALLESIVRLAQASRKMKVRQEVQYLSHVTCEANCLQPSLCVQWL